MITFTNKIISQLTTMKTHIAVPSVPYKIPDYLRIISAMSNTRNRLGAARLCYAKLGQGSGRMVFGLDATAVLKLAYNKKGIAQNKAESKASLSPYYNTLLVPVLASDPTGKWLIQARIMPLSETGWKKFFQTDEGNVFYRKARLFARLNGLNPYDLTKAESVGFNGANYLIFDYGLTETIYSKQYA